MSFTRMDESTPEQWRAIITAKEREPDRVADRVLLMLASLAEITEGFSVDQLTHSLQTATRAERAGASDEWVLAALCHDIGKAVSDPNHPAIAAEILRPYVTRRVYWAVRVHQDFVSRHYAGPLGRHRRRWVRHLWHPGFGLARRFADEWDQVSFDPDYHTLPLSHFEPLVRRMLRRPRPPGRATVARRRVHRTLHTAAARVRRSGGS